MKALTENTLIPVSLVIVFLGGVVWLTTLSNQTQANTQMLSEVRSKQDAYATSLYTIEKTLVRIEAHLEDPRDQRR